MARGVSATAVSGAVSCSALWAETPATEAQPLVSDHGVGWPYQDSVPLGRVAAGDIRCGGRLLQDLLGLFCVGVGAAARAARRRSCSWRSRRAFRQFGSKALPQKLCEPTS